MSRAAACSQVLSACFLWCCLLAVASFGRETPTGKELFQTRCAGCHSLDADKVGPRLRTIFGKPSGSVQSFKYSDAVKAAHIRWDEATLDKWLADPETVIPDNDMSFRLENSHERTAIIDYLRQLGTK